MPAIDEELPSVEAFRVDAQRQTDEQGYSLGETESPGEGVGRGRTRNQQRKAKLKRSRIGERCLAIQNPHSNHFTSANLVGSPRDNFFMNLYANENLS
jgi:hypothetical protein